MIYLSNFYKVVDPELKSIQSWQLPPELIIQYSTDKWVYPQIGKIFVFESYKHAHNFCLRVLHNKIIYQCQIQNPEKIQYCLSPISRNYLYFSSWWKTLKSDKANKVIPGTVFVSAVKLTSPC